MKLLQITATNWGTVIWNWEGELVLKCTHAPSLALESGYAHARPGILFSLTLAFFCFPSKLWKIKMQLVKKCTLSYYVHFLLEEIQK